MRLIGMIWNKIMECSNKKCIRSAQCGILDITGKVPQGSCSYFKENKNKEAENGNGTSGTDQTIEVQ